MSALNTINVLHIVPHLGGGVGKALSTLADDVLNTQYKHTFLLLEKPKKYNFLNKIIESGCDVIVASSHVDAMKLIDNADIVQLEWWNHPATFRFLCENNFPEMRLIVWSHVSGLHTPIIPVGLMSLGHRFLFTSECSLRADYLTGLNDREYSQLDVVSSGVGFLPNKRRQSNTSLSYGYLGSLNSSKIHPDFVLYLSQVGISDFRLNLWGDKDYLKQLLSQCHDYNKPDLINYMGYAADPSDALNQLDVFIYLLNPKHYGTAENALLEAMSQGVIPIVYNNPAETVIVEHGVSGLVVNNQEEFLKSIEWLENNPHERNVMSRNAADRIASQYTPEILRKKLYSHYSDIASLPKVEVDFRAALGSNPYEWFMSCQQHKGDSPGNKLQYDDTHEITKGSVRHFLQYFPFDAKLRDLEENLKANTNIF